MKPSILPAMSLLLLSASACSWDRFEQLRVDTPVVELQPTQELSARFGGTLAGLPAGDRTSVLAGNVPLASGASLYMLGAEEEPGTSPLDPQYCIEPGNVNGCRLAAQPAGMRSVFARGLELSSCYVTGVGWHDAEDGLIGRCEDATDFILPVPDDVRTDVVLPARSGSRTHEVVLAADRGESPILLAGVGGLGRAFYYEAGTNLPVDVPTPDAAPLSYGQMVAVLRGPSAWVLAVAAPEAAEVRLFSTSGAGPTPVGCVSGAAQTGWRLAAGDYDGDGWDDLAVSDERDVRILSGQGLGTLTENTDAGCSLAVPTEDLVLVELSCRPFGDASDCKGSRFGSAVAIADFDGDGTQEVAVGAPHMTVRGFEGAGAVLVFDHNGEAVDVAFPSSLAEGDLFGTKIVALPQESHDILIASAPGAARVTISYCTHLVGSGTSPRCP